MPQGMYLLSMSLFISSSSAAGVVTVSNPPDAACCAFGEQELNVNAKASEMPAACEMNLTLLIFSSPWAKAPFSRHHWRIFDQNFQNYSGNSQIL
jgi:hypothetical protein